MYDMKNLTKLKKLGELAPEAFKGFVAFDEAAFKAVGKERMGEVPQTRPTAWSMRSMALIPTKGTMMPPPP